MNSHSRRLALVICPLIMASIAHGVAGQQTSSSIAKNAEPAVVSSTPSADMLHDSAPELKKRDWRYKIHTSDTLELTFLLTPEFNQTVTVQPDGYITLREVGDLPVANHTLPEITESIKTAYSNILHDPVLSVEPKDFEKPYFVVGGQVARPGKFDWRGEVTLTQAIAMAGGFTEAAKHSQVLLFRRVSDQWSEAKIINVKKMLNSRNLQEDPVLQPGDMLVVPKNAISKIKPFLPTSGLGAYYNPGTI